jgi:hypothetical protein
MRNVIKLNLMAALILGSGTLLIAATGQQKEEPNAPPQQESSSAQGQASSSAAVKSVTGCVVQSDHGYSLKTENDTYPIETGKDLSRYVNKKVEITGLLEHHNASTPSATAGSTATVTDIRLRMVVTVIGDCDQSHK